MAMSDRGFASMDKAKRKAIAAMGGRAVHTLGQAHEWTRETARKAGQKGGIAAHAKRLAKRAADAATAA